jgi:phosphosulfolactate phosphohydrolase-like enzyme
MQSLVGYTAPLIIITFPKGGARGASTTGAEVKKMSTTQTETIGSGRVVSKQLDLEKVALEKGGMNVVTSKANLDFAVEDAAVANATQESLKHQLAEMTKLVEAKMHRAYVVMSGTIDMMMAAVEKNSETAKVFQRLRSKIRQAGDQTAAEPLPVPVQEATK